MSWTLFNSFGTVAKVKEAELNKKAGLADEESLKKAIALEVKEAFFNLETAQKDFEIAGLSNRLSRLSLKTEEAKLKVGMKTELDVLEKKVNSLESETGLITSNYNLILAQAKLNKAVGEEVFEIDQ
jgi:outer membrane protein TolC